MNVYIILIIFLIILLLFSFFLILNKKYKFFGSTRIAKNKQIAMVSSYLYKWTNTANCEVKKLIIKTGALAKDQLPNGPNTFDYLQEYTNHRVGDLITRNTLTDYLTDDLDSQNYSGDYITYDITNHNNTVNIEDVVAAYNINPINVLQNTPYTVINNNRQNDYIYFSLCFNLPLISNPIGLLEGISHIYILKYCLKFNKSVVIVGDLSCNDLTSYYQNPDNFICYNKFIRTNIDNIRGVAYSRENYMILGDTKDLIDVGDIPLRDIYDDKNRVFEFDFDDIIYFLYTIKYGIHQYRRDKIDYQKLPPYIQSLMFRFVKKSRGIRRIRKDVYEESLIKTKPYEGKIEYREKLSESRKKLKEFMNTFQAYSLKYILLFFTNFKRLVLTQPQQPNQLPIINNTIFSDFCQVYLNDLIDFKFDDTVINDHHYNEAEDFIKKYKDKIDLMLKIIDAIYYTLDISGKQLTLNRQNNVVLTDNITTKKQNDFLYNTFNLLNNHIAQLELDYYLDGCDHNNEIRELSDNDVDIINKIVDKWLP